MTSLFRDLGTFAINNSLAASSVRSRLGALRLFPSPCFQRLESGVLDSRTSDRRSITLASCPQDGI